MATILTEPEEYLSGGLAQFAHELCIRRLPAPVIAIARQHLLDTVGCCLAAKDLDTSRALAAWLVSERGAEQATAIGVGRRLPAAQAAFLHRIADAIGIAISLASGSLEANRSGGTIKRFQSGWAAICHSGCMPC